MWLLLKNILITTKDEKVICSHFVVARNNKERLYANPFFFNALSLNVVM